MGSFPSCDKLNVSEERKIINKELVIILVLDLMIIHINFWAFPYSNDYIINFSFILKEISFVVVELFSIYFVFFVNQIPN